MLETTITPQFSDSDALGHANYQATVRWFETGRLPIYRLIAPDFGVLRGNDRASQQHFLAIVHMEVDYVDEMLVGADVLVKTWVTKIGRSSFHVEQVALQNEKRCSSGRVVLVYYDLLTRKSKPLPEEVRGLLEKLRSY